MKTIQTPSTVVVPAGRLCPRCGGPLGGFGPEGLCGVCLFDSGLAADEPFEEVDLFASGLRKFGNYELLEETARGGMGVIFKARHLSLNRIVAVKMILRGEFASVGELARFRAEAETAARLQHPNIVAIHEVGECAGQPYFSMDYVEGQNLAQLIGNTPLPAVRAAKYLKIIAEAVQYAHARGVLHRDLKPSNVLIDASDQPRVTDFGLAKRLDSQLSTGDPQLTQTGQVLGSPSFMPPEQATGRNAAIGAASDVYSLGAMLYHALTGRPPFVAESVPATLRLVAESEAVSPRLLNTSVPRDLETICLKCLQKEPQRRYATAQELAEELNHFLRDEPIRAHPISAVARLWRWSRRNRALASTSAAVFVLLLTVAIGSPIAALRINHERVQAEQMRKQAETNAEKMRAEAIKSQQIARFLQEMLAYASPWASPRRDTTLLREIVDKTAVRVGNDLKDQPDVEAALRETLGNVYWALGELDKAEDMERKALVIKRRLFGEEHKEVAQSLATLGSVLRSQRKFEDAEATIREALAMRRKLLGNNDPLVAQCLISLALVFRQAGKFEEAERMHREHLEIARAANGLGLGGSLGSYAYTLLLDKKFTEAESTARELLFMYQTNNPEGWEFFSAQSMLGRALLGQKRYSEAEPLFLSGYAGLIKCEDMSPPGIRPPVLGTLEGIAELYQAWGKPEQAAEWKEKLDKFDRAGSVKKGFLP